MKIKEIPFVGYPVTEKQRARDFYEGVLRLEPGLDTQTPEGYWLEYKVGADTLAISNYWKPSAAPAMGPAAALEVEDFDQCVAYLKEMGIPLIEGPLESKMCSMVMIADPDQNSLWIHKRRPNRLPYRGPEIPFVCYPVTDKQRARDFFEGTLGLEAGPADYEAPDGFWREYMVGEGALALCNFWKPSAQPSMAPSVGLEVDDFSAAVAELQSRQVPFAFEPAETPFCHLCAVTDPDGNSLIIHQRKPEHPLS